MFGTETPGLVTLPPEATVLFLGAVALGAGQEVCFHGNPCAVMLRVGVACQVGDCYVLERVSSPRHGD